MTVIEQSGFRPLPATIQHVTTSLDMGGAQAMLVKLVMAAAASELQHVIVSLMKPGSLTPPQEQAAGLIYSLQMKRGLPGPRAVIDLLRITASTRPDLLQGWMYHGNIAASVAGMLSFGPVPVLWNVRHSLADPCVESRGTRLLLSLGARLSRHTAAIIYNSMTAAREHEAIGFCRDRRVYIPNGFDCVRYAPDPEARARLRERLGIAEAAGLLIGLVARLHPMKDHAMLIKAVGQARAGGADLHLLCVGTSLDAPPARLVEAVAQAGIPADRITFAGERRDVAEWLPGLDICALPSAWGEAFPNILGEAMACGVPCIATDVGDSGAVIGDSGILVPPRDAGAMAAGLLQLAQEGPAARRERGLAGRKRVLDTYQLAAVARQYERLYRSILTEAAARGDGRPQASVARVPVEAR